VNARFAFERYSLSRRIAAKDQTGETGGKEFSSLKE
jgi:hypothetical protein